MSVAKIPNQQPKRTCPANSQSTPTALNAGGQSKRPVCGLGFEPVLIQVGSESQPPVIEKGSQTYKASQHQHDR